MENINVQNINYVEIPENQEYTPKDESILNSVFIIKNFGYKETDYVENYIYSTTVSALNGRSKERARVLGYYCITVANIVDLKLGHFCSPQFHALLVYNQLVRSRYSGAGSIKDCRLVVSGNWRGRFCPNWPDPLLPVRV